MEKSFKISLIILAALLLCSCKSTGVDTEKCLKVEGTRLTCGGEDAVFRGLSLGWHNIWPRFYNAQAIGNLAQQTPCRLFRAAIGADDHAKTDNPSCHGGYMSEPQFALECLFNVVDEALARDCYVIVDFHSHVLHKEEARDFFTKVATRYADSPQVIYELFNEPVCQSFEDEHSYADLGDPEAMMRYWKSLKAYAEDLIGTITSISRVHPLILMGCPCWDQRVDLPAADPITVYDNLMYTLHFYAATHQQSLRDAATEALSSGIPLFISECAACEASGDGDMDIEQWNEWNRWASDNGVSMAVWSISDKDETCSMFTPEASSEGPWCEDVVKPWGKVVYDWL